MFKLNILRLIYRKEPPYYFFRGTNVHKYCQAGVDCTYQNYFSVVCHFRHVQIVGYMGCSQDDIDETIVFTASRHSE